MTKITEGTGGTHKVELPDETLTEMTTAELMDLAAACELRLASAEGREPAMVIRLTLPAHKEDCPEEEQVAPHEWQRMAGSSAQLAGIALKFISMPGVVPAVQQWLTDKAMEEEGLTAEERLNGVTYARDLNSRVLRQLSNIFLAFSEQSLDDEAADTPS